MADDLENKDLEEKESKGEESSEEQAPKGVLINLKTIIIGAGAFVIFLAGFSFLMGVFSPSAEPVADQSAVVEDSASHGTGASAHKGDSATSEWGEGYEDPVIITSDSIMSEEDSVAQVKWYQAQRQEIEEERTKLRVEAAQVKHLKMEYETLLNRVEGIEHENIANMAKLFETMKAEEVARIMENIPNSKVGMILQKMKKQSASDVMASMPAERAARITMELIDIDGKE